jgi:sugar/nucleoside kinase (ribokinase family)
MADHDLARVSARLPDADGVYVPCFDATLGWAELAWKQDLQGLVLDLMDLADLDEAWIQRAVERAALVFAGLGPGHPALPLLRSLAARPGAALVVATLGAAGALAFAGERELAISAAPLPGLLVDTTGCGDAFAGTFVAHWRRSAPLEDALRAASERAARVATHRGAVLGPPV